MSFENSNDNGACFYVDSKGSSFDVVPQLAYRMRRTAGLIVLQPSTQVTLRAKPIGSNL